MTGHQEYDRGNLYKMFFVGAFDLKETCYTLSKLKLELPEIAGSEDTCCITKKFVLMSSILKKNYISG